MEIGKVRTISLGLFLLFCPKIFYFFCQKWATDSAENIKESVQKLRDRFWNALFINVVIFGTTVSVMLCFEKIDFNSEFLIRLVAAFLALQASLGRGGWEIQTWKGQTLVERIDRGLYRLQLLGGSVLLILALAK